MADQKTIFRHLTKRVALDKDTITYRLLARELGITVKDAKSSMASFILDEAVIARGGVVPTWLISGLLKPVVVKGEGEEDKMEVDSEEVEAGPSNSSSSSSSSEVIKIRSNLLVADSNLAAKLQLFESTASTQIYSLSPIPLHTLTLLTAYNLTNQNSEKWKKVETPGGYGTIIHPEGEMRKKLSSTDIKGKGKINTIATTTKRIIEEKKTIVKSEVEGKGKGKEVVKEKPAMRPIGALGGLFAKSTTTATVTTTVPKKRKSSPQPFFKTVVKKEVVVAKEKKKEKEVPKKKTKIVSGGIWGDEEVTDDGEDDEEEGGEALIVKAEQEDDDGEDRAAEEAMRELERAEEKKLKDKEKKKLLIQKGKDGAKETKKEKESRELEIMMLSDEDDDMEIDVPATKASTSKAVVKPATKVSAAPKKATESSKPMGSFFKKA